MSLWASIKVAVASLRVNALRTALTMLGIIIGVGAVIVMVAVAPGRRRAWPNSSSAWAPT